MKREHLTGLLFCLEYSLKALRKSKWVKSLDNEYSYASGLIGGAVLVDAITLAERDRLMSLAENAREYARKEML